MATIGYARVSTDEQNLDSQLTALERAGCERIYRDKTTGKLRNRPEWDKCLAALREGDELVVTRFSRAGRSLKHLVELVEDLKDRRVAFRSLREGPVEDSPTGRLTYGIFALLAQFQRELIVEGTIEGMAAAKANGKRVGGSDPKLSPEQVRAARKLIDSGETVAAVARGFGVHRATIYRALERGAA